MVQTSNLTKFCAMYMYITPFFVVYRCCYSNHSTQLPLVYLMWAPSSFHSVSLDDLPGAQGREELV